jgi:putative FmdB family regulatory protein
MPTYEYECKDCNHRQEYQIRFEVGPDCEKCFRTMTRVWTAPGIQFKGTGWGGSYSG